MTAARALEEVWRTEAASMRGALARRLGDLDRAEDALQEALAQAMRHWPQEGIPVQPAGWLVTTAWRKAVDQLRREEAGRAKLAYSVPIGAPDNDDLLALVFGCCHPDLGEAAQIALTLRAVCGLTTEEIAAAFLVPVPTMAQRLVRANRLVREREVPFAIPSAEEYPDRLTSVLTVIYLVYNEGYLANSAESAQRRDLAAQALGLIRQLELLMPGEQEVTGLAVLLELCEARAAARFDADGRLILLDEQDRSTWDGPAIEAAVRRLDRALLRGRPGRYQTQAAIAALHATASSYKDTDWLQIRLLYLELHRQTGSPLALLSASVATWHARDAAQGLAEVDRLADRLDGNRLFHATRAEMLRELGRHDEARAALDRALSLAVNPAEKLLLTERLTSMEL
jgi:RNA polymerase sigma-70 factor (ECF subfamily)